MSDDELYEIVKDHTEAWPKDVRDHPSGFLLKHDGGGEPGTHEFVMPTEHAVFVFEASFQRALQEYSYSVITAVSKHCARVTVQHHDFEAPTLIEAYAKALEWLK